MRWRMLHHLNQENARMKLNKLESRWEEVSFSSSEEEDFCNIDGLTKAEQKIVDNFDLRIEDRMHEQQFLESIALR